MSSRRGVTFAEYLVASFIFLIVLSAVLTLIPYAAHATAHSRARVQADNIATSVISDYRVQPFSNLSPSGTIVLPEVVLERGRKFVPTVELKSYGGLDPDRVLELKVTVEWGSGRKKKRIVRTLLLSDVEGD